MAEKFTLKIFKDKLVSDDSRFKDEGYVRGKYGKCKPVEVYFEKGNGEKGPEKAFGWERNPPKLPRLPRLAAKIFKKELDALSAEEREKFPVSDYTDGKGNKICGIYLTESEYQQRQAERRTEGLVLCYNGDDQNSAPTLLIYGNNDNIFSTLPFVQECLNRWGEEGDRFILMYREEKTEREKKSNNGEELQELPTNRDITCRNKLLTSKNLILRGAPGTGKSYLAKQIAADIISNGVVDDFSSLSDEQKRQVEFVQFHPSYDYTDFVEGLRPKKNDDGSIGFELKDGIFKQFVARARKNYEDYANSKDDKKLAEQKNKRAVQEAMSTFFIDLNLGVDKFKTIKGNEFYITNVDEDEESVDIVIPNNPTVKNLKLNLAEIRKMLESDKTFERITDITNFFEKKFATQAYSYDFALYKEIQTKLKSIANKTADREVQAAKNELKKYVFIIDEINRGEISKIFGELFYSIDPSYRGKAGEISTQYANLHPNQDDKFYIPENVYIIGTMNDIDRSVDSFDFAMRRRFRFAEISAHYSEQMLAQLNDSKMEKEAKDRMESLNEAIKNTEGLNENYQIGASYFLKLKDIEEKEGKTKFDLLWTDYLQPLLQEYVRGMSNEAKILDELEKAYNNLQQSSQSDVREDTQR